jgi:predicted O-methyltransferase YrrM
VTTRGFWRRAALGLATLAGAPRGFFIPHRYASELRPLVGYPALAPLFRAAEAQFRARLTETAAYMAVFATFRPAAPPAPRFEQDWFPGLDAAVAYAFMRTRKPARVVEIGSGHSTRFIARAIADGGLATRLTAIDPAPRASLTGLQIEWLRMPLQRVDGMTFASLAPGDVLFVDSSHVLMPGSDVDLILNHIWPRLPPGVLVHIHDIFLPDRYPESWTWRGYNEQNAIAPLLASHTLLWSSRWVAARMADALSASPLAALPRASDAFETSLWLEKR